MRLLALGEAPRCWHMRFDEAEQEYRELEEKLVRGELSEQAFLLRLP